MSKHARIKGHPMKTASGKTTYRKGHRRSVTSSPMSRAPEEWRKLKRRQRREEFISLISDGLGDLSRALRRALVRHQPAEAPKPIPAEAPKLIPAARQTPADFNAGQSLPSDHFASVVGARRGPANGDERERCVKCKRPSGCLVAVAGARVCASCADDYRRGLPRCTRCLQHAEVLRASSDGEVCGSCLRKHTCRECGAEESEDLAFAQGQECVARYGVEIAHARGLCAKHVRVAYENEQRR
jgi:hypothetical protein